VTSPDAVPAPPARPVPAAGPWSVRIGRAATAAGIAGLTGVLVLVVSVAWLVLRDSRVDLRPEDFVPSGTATSGGIALLEGAVDVSDAVCGAGASSCTSAGGTDALVVMHFATKDAAARAARSLGPEAYRSDWLVARFVGDDVPAEQRLWATEALDGAWQSEVD
jgi:hypothetical protein